MRPDERRRPWWPAGAAVLVALLVACGLLGLLLRPWERAPSPTSRAPAGSAGDRHLEATVKQVEPGRNSVILAHGLLGLDVTHVRVERETEIWVGDKEGALGDLREGRRVRVAYRLGPEGPVARSIAVLLPEGEGPPRARAGAPPPPPPPVAPAAGPTAEVAGARTRQSAPEPETGPVERRAPAAPPTTLPPRPPRLAGEQAADPRGTRAEPALPTRPSKPAPEAASLPAAPPTAPAATPAPPPSGRPRTADDDPDPAAVVDWLLKEYPTRRR